MADLILNFRVLNDGQAKSALRGVKSAALEAGRAMDHAGQGGRRSAQQMGRAWSAAGRPLRATERLAMQVARDQERAAKKAADVQVREAKRVAREQERAANKSAEAQLRAARRVERYRERAMRGAARLRDRMDAAKMSRRERALTGLAGGVSGFVGGAVSRAAGALVVGGVALGGAALRSQVALSDQARRISRKGGGTVSGEQLLAESEDVRRRVRGTKTSDILEAQSAFVTKTGDLDAARRFSSVFAEISLATNTAADEIGAAAADLFQKFDIKTVRDMSEAMAGLAVQGKRGAFELEDAARLFPRILASARRFGVEGNKEGLLQIGGLTQIARQSTGSGEEAATAVENAFTQLVKKSSTIEGLGVDVFADKGKTQGRDFRDVITETIGATGGNQQKLTDIFGIRGIRAVSPLITTFNQTKAAAIGTEEERTAIAMAAVRSQLDEAANSSGALAEIQRDLADAQQDSSARVTAAWEEVRSQVGAALLPIVGDVLNAMSGLPWGEFATQLGNMVQAASAAANSLWNIEERDPNKSRSSRFNQTRDEREGRAARYQAAVIRAEAARDERELTEDEKKQLANLDQEAAKAPKLPAGADPDAINPSDEEAFNALVNKADTGSGIPAPPSPTEQTAGELGGFLGKLFGDLGEDPADLGKVKGKSREAAGALGELLTAANLAAEQLREAGGAARAFKESEGS